MTLRDFHRMSLFCNGEPGVTRTLGPLLRRQMLYPTELQAQIALVSYLKRVLISRLISKKSTLFEKLSFF